MGKTFKYKDFVNKLRFQIGGICSEEFYEEGEKYIRETTHSYTLKFAKMLHENPSVMDTACEIITQNIAKWTYHKTIDLIIGEIPYDLHDQIIEKINNEIYDFLIEENKECPLTSETIEEPEIKNLLSNIVKDSYRDILSHLYSDNKITRDTYELATSQSHIDKKIEIKNIDYEKTDVFEINSTNKTLYLETLITTPYLSTFYILAIAFSIIAIIITSIEKSFSTYIFVTSLVFLINGFINNLINNYSIIKDTNINTLKEELEDIKVAGNPNSLYHHLGVDTISIKIGLGLVHLTKHDNKLLHAILKLRKDLTDELGYIIPNIKITDSPDLKPNECVIYIRNTKRERFFITPKDTDKEEIITNHIKGNCIKYANEIITKTEVLKLMEIIRAENPTLVNDLIPTLISATDVKRILVNLIKEQVSIKDLAYIFDRLCDFARFNKQPDVLSEHLRTEMKTSICLQHAVVEQDEQYPILYALTLSPSLEKLLEEHLQITNFGFVFTLKTPQIDNLIISITKTLSKFETHNKDIVLLVSPKIRLALFNLLAPHIKNIKILSFSELITEIKVEILEEIN